MKVAREVATQTFAELMRVSREGGVVKSKAIDIIADALESYAATQVFAAVSERGPEQTRGVRPELIAFARAIEGHLRTFTEEDGYRRVGTSKAVEELHKSVLDIEEELTSKTPQDLARKTAKIASSAFILADNADAFSDVPLLDRDRFSRFHQSGGAELLAQVFHEARQEIVVEPVNRRTWEETGETTRKNLVAVCAHVLDALEDETS